MLKRNDSSSIQWLAIAFLAFCFGVIVTPLKTQLNEDKKVEVTVNQEEEGLTKYRRKQKITYTSDNQDSQLETKEPISKKQATSSAEIKKIKTEEGTVLIEEYGCIDNQNNENFWDTLFGVEDKNKDDMPCKNWQF